MRSRVALAAVATSFILSGCSKNDKNDSARKPVQPPTVVVTATEYAFDAPDTIASGPTVIRLVNHGMEAHHVSMFRLDSAHTVQDMMAQPEGASPAWIVPVGGPNAATPGDSVRATINLEPGNYVMLCFIPSADLKPHFMKGMVRPITVVAATGPVAAEPEADVVATLKEYSFEFAPAITSGRHTIRINNAGNQDHEMILVRLQPGKKIQDFVNWTNTMQGPSPGQVINGMSGLGSGQHAFVTDNFTPGDYGLVCFVPDNKDGKSHFMHGMMQDFTVS
ncbi:MAG: hypothetical protein ABI836_16005 [Gemmatimonadota bacterium]